MLQDPRPVPQRSIIKQHRRPRQPRPLRHQPNL